MLVINYFFCSLICKFIVPIFLGIKLSVHKQNSWDFKLNASAQPWRLVSNSKKLMGFLALDIHVFSRLQQVLMIQWRFSTTSGSPTMNKPVASNQH